MTKSCQKLKSETCHKHFTSYTKLPHGHGCKITCHRGTGTLSLYTTNQRAKAAWMHISCLLQGIFSLMETDSTSAARITLTALPGAAARKLEYLLMTKSPKDQCPGRFRMYQVDRQISTNSKPCTHCHCEPTLSLAQLPSSCPALSMPIVFVIRRTDASGPLSSSCQACVTCSSEP